MNDLFQPLARLHQVELMCCTAAPTLPRIRGDGARLLQVLGNLVANAL